MKAVVTGMIGTFPVGGVVWDYGQYLLGLQRLGFDVTYLEDPGCPTYDPDKGLYGDDPAYGVAYIARSLAELSPRLAGNWHFRAMDDRRFGIETADLEQRLTEADLFLNISGGCLMRDEYAKARNKVLIDTDPGFNQFVNYPHWDRWPGWLGARSFREHDHFFTYAERLGHGDCAIPDCGITWRTTRPPVLLDLWRPEPPGETWTTVMTWNTYRKPVEFEGRTYGSKELEFGHVEAMPLALPAKFEIAVGGHDPPLDELRQKGWSVVDSHSVSRTSADYREYIQRSRAELSVAKNIYAATRSGWFSCRSVCYLASGRPVVLQDTGWSHVVEHGAGLVPFSDAASARAAVARIEADYDAHAAAAREVAAASFDSDRVLGKLLDDIGLG